MQQAQNTIVLGSGFQASSLGLRFRVQGFRFRVSAIGFGDQGFGLWAGSGEIDLNIPILELFKTTSQRRTIIIHVPSPHIP